eukprot:1488393-Prymnesium_polylepis.2
MVALIPKLKLVTSLCQTVALLPAVFDLQLPDSYHQWVAFLAVFEIDWNELVFPGQCLGGGYSMWLLIRAAAPLVVLVGISVITATAILGVHAALQTKPSLLASRIDDRPSFRNSLLPLLPYMLAFTFCLTPTTSTDIFRAWDCETFQIDSRTIPPQTVKLLRADLSLECTESDTEYARSVSLAYVLVGICQSAISLEPERVVQPSRLHFY